MDYKLVTYKTARGARAGFVVDDRVYDAGESVLAILGRKPVLKRSFPLKRARLLAPIPSPGAIFCAGANYTDHMAEMARALGREPGRTQKDAGPTPWPLD